MFAQLLFNLAVILGFVLVILAWAAFSKDEGAKRVWRKYGPFLLRFLKVEKLLHRYTTEPSLELLKLEAGNELLERINQEMERKNRLFKSKIDEQKQLLSIMKSKNPDVILTACLVSKEIEIEGDRLSQELDELSGKAKEQVTKNKRSSGNLIKQEKSIDRYLSFVLALYTRAGLA